MGRDLGGVEYDEDAALYPGAVFPEPEGEEEDVYRTEVLLTMSEEDGLEDREREALAIAGKIRRIVGTLPVVDKESGELRPAGYGISSSSCGPRQAGMRYLKRCWKKAASLFISPPKPDILRRRRFRPY